MRKLETTIPPPVVMLLLGGVAWVAAQALPAFAFPLPFARWVAVGLAVAGLALNLSPKLAFRRAGTTVNPLDPAATTQLVTSGVYRYTRNPMYLGHGVILLAWAIYLHHAAVFLAVPAFVFYVARFQVGPEERHLSARFPEQYAAYRSRVPRWL